MNQAPRRNRQNNGKQLSQEYQEYMESDAWRDLRNRKYTENGYRCQACGVKYNDTSCLEVHHTHYDSFTFEDTSDLLVLCLLCHDVIGMIREMRKIQYCISDPRMKSVMLEQPFSLEHIEDFVLRYRAEEEPPREADRYDSIIEYRDKIVKYYDSCIVAWESGPTQEFGHQAPILYTKEKTDEKQEEPLGIAAQSFHDESHIFGCGFRSADGHPLHQDIIDEYLETVSERIRDEVDRNHHRFGKIGRNRLSDIALGENGVDIEAEELFNLIKSLKTESGEVLGTIKRTKDMPLTWREGLTQQQDFNIRLLYLAVHGHIGIKKLVRGSKSVELSFIDGCLEKETVDDRDMESLRLKTDESLKKVLNKKETSPPPPKEEKTKPKSRMSRWLTVTKDLMFKTFRLKYK